MMELSALRSIHHKLDTMLKNHSKQLEKTMIKTNFDTLKKLYGLARNNNLNVNHKELSVKISGRTKHNHELLSFTWIFAINTTIQSK